MSKHYKKLILLLIPACAGFCLALALGSADESSELCHLCQNKALVKEAITSYVIGTPYSYRSGLLDPNYVQHGPAQDFDFSLDDMWIFSNIPLANFNYELTVDPIIAEGDMVAVLGSWTFSYFQALDKYDYDYTQLAIFRIADGMIVEGWIAPAWYNKVLRWPEE